MVEDNFDLILRMSNLSYRHVVLFLFVSKLPFFTELMHFAGEFIVF